MPSTLPSACLSFRWHDVTRMTSSDLDICLLPHYCRETSILLSCPASLDYFTRTVATDRDVFPRFTLSASFARRGFIQDVLQLAHSRLNVVLQILRSSRLALFTNILFGGGQTTRLCRFTRDRAPHFSRQNSGTLMCYN